MSTRNHDFELRAREGLWQSMRRFNIWPIRRWRKIANSTISFNKVVVKAISLGCVCKLICLMMGVLSWALVFQSPIKQGINSWMNSNRTSNSLKHSIRLIELISVNHKAVNNNQILIGRVPWWTSIRQNSKIT